MSASWNTVKIRHDMLDERILGFLSSLTLPKRLPSDVEVMNPYMDKDVMHLVRDFYTTFFHDNDKRTGLFGINPGRLGAGLTGIPFTDPKRLRDQCGIDNTLNAHEPSSEFVYMVIDRMGGPALFFRRFFISSLCPLGFTESGKNLNYYDRNDLQNAIEPFITRTLNQQIQLGLHTRAAVILGAGKNLKFIERLNGQHSFFTRIVGLPHPRFIIQYKRRFLTDYLDIWERTLEEVSEQNGSNVP